MRSLRRARGPRIEIWETAWRRAAGPDLARRTRVAGLQDGFLVIEVASAALKHHLAVFAGDRILKRIRKLLPDKNLRGIRYRVGEIRG